MFNRSTYVLREKTGTTGVEITARAAVEILAHWDVPHLAVGGLAVQEHGYERVTTYVDLVVPDVLEAVEFLTADFAGPFKVPCPKPEAVSEIPQVVTIEQLVSLKLDSFSGSPLKRLRDKTDVIELVQRAHLPRDLAVAAPICDLYLEIWDGLKADDAPPVHPT